MAGEGAFALKTTEENTWINGCGVAQSPSQSSIPSASTGLWQSVDVVVNCRRKGQEIMTSSHDYPGAITLCLPI